MIDREGAFPANRKGNADVNPNLTRRELLKGSALGLGGLLVSPLLNRTLWAEASATPKKVLFFTKSSGFQHSVITRPDVGKLAFAEQLLTDWGAKNGFEVTCSKDGSVFTSEKIAQFDVFAFCTTGDLTRDSKNYLGKKNAKGVITQDKSLAQVDEPGMPPGGKEAFLDAIKQGKGFVGFHCATDTFHSKGHVRGKVDFARDVDAQGRDDFDPYIQMIGGEFIIHGKQQKANLKTIDPKWPGAEAFNDARFVEEWYSLKDFANDLHLILAQDCAGMTGEMYQRGPYPETWARMHGQGRVFYTSMGHREDVWEKPEFQTLVIGALNWASRRIGADVTPNIEQATPEANVKAAAATK
jgi:hypothetical protein